MTTGEAPLRLSCGDVSLVYAEQIAGPAKAVDPLSNLYRDCFARAKMAIEDEARRKWVELLRASVPSDGTPQAANHRLALSRAEKAIRVKRDPMKERRANTPRGRKRRSLLRARPEAASN